MQDTHTLEDDTKRALPNLLSDPEVIAHNAIGGSGLGVMC